MAMNIHTDQLLGHPINPAAGRGREAKERLEAFIGGSTLMLFVKGTPDQPRCGFSATVIDIFNRIGVPYATFDVLSDPEIRQGAKTFSQWPTFPQIYVGGEFVGGCDIVTQMFQEGELQSTVREAFDAHGPGRALTTPDDAPVHEPFPVPEGARASGEGLAEVRQIRPRRVSLMGFDSFLVLDVREQSELEIATLGVGHLLPLGDFAHSSKAIAKDVNVLLICRSGNRSNQAGEYLISQGYRHVWNLDGGILAWSDEVDSSIQKY